MCVHSAKNVVRNYYFFTLHYISAIRHFQFSLKKSYKTSPVSLRTNHHNDIAVKHNNSYNDNMKLSELKILLKYVLHNCLSRKNKHLNENSWSMFKLKISLNYKYCSSKQ